MAAQQQGFLLCSSGRGVLAGTAEKRGAPVGCHWELSQGPLALWQLGHAAELRARYYSGTSSSLCLILPSLPLLSGDLNI